MNERTKKVEAIFHAASELSTPEERESYLNEACLEDADLRREVEALLKAAPVGDEMFRPREQSGVRSSGVTIEPLAEQTGSVIGRYKLLEKIGEGGMGVVYMAEQEQPVRRKVALKIIKLGMDTRQVVARFEAERQALAMMDHPNIAKVLDGGATDSPVAAGVSPASEPGVPPGGKGSDDANAFGGAREISVGKMPPSLAGGAPAATLSAGRPYFVMELVQGVPITQFCDANQLSIEERLELFLPVCHAIQSAHQKGIIHRDIKPSNVLVTMHNGVPHPMVIDFGVARAINQRLTEKTLFTNFATMIGTPAYMSPEQAEMSKLDVDTRSDIYSLGVLLYELLTRTTPFPEERLRSVAYGEMQRIIAEEEPERPSTRLRKRLTPKSQIPNRKSQIDPDLDWIVMKCLEKDRNRRYVTANGLAADIQAHLKSEPVIARPPSAAYRFQKFVRRHKLQFVAVTIIVVALVVASVVSSWQALIARRERRAAQTQAEIARSVKEFLTEQLLSANPYVTPESNPNRRAILEQVAGALEGKFANQPAVEAEIRYALESGFSGLADVTNALVQSQRLLELRRRTLGPTHSDTRESMAYVALHYLRLGRRKEAKMLVDEGMRASNASSPELSFGAAWLVFARGSLLRADGRPAETLPDMKKALPILIRTMKPTDHRLSIAMWEAAYITQEAGQTEEAERLWAEGIRHFEREFSPDHPATAQFQKGLAYAFLERGRWREAMELLERAVATYHRSLGTNHNNVLDAEDLLARAHEQKGDIETAARIYASTHPRWVKHFPYGPALDHCEIIANFFVRHRRYEEARAVFRSVRESFETNPPERTADFERFIAATGATKGWPVAAEVCRKYSDRFGDAPTICQTIGTVFLYVGEENWYRGVTAKAIASAPAITNWQNQLAILHIAARGPFTFSPEQRNQCEALMQSVERALPGVAREEQTRAHRAIGALQLRLGELTNGLAHLETALQTSKEPAGRARTLLLKALCLHGLDRIEKARAAFVEAEGILKGLLFDRLSEAEGFLSDADRYAILLHREAQALLGLK